MHVAKMLQEGDNLTDEQKLDMAYVCEKVGEGEEMVLDGELGPAVEPHLSPPVCYRHTCASLSLLQSVFFPSGSFAPPTHLSSSCCGLGGGSSWQVS